MDGFGDYDWVAWFGLAALLGIVEVTTLDLVFAMLATGALAAGVTGILTDSAPLQILVFLVVSVAMLAVARPLALKHLHTPLAIRTGTAALVGQRGIVLEPVDGQGGRVKLKGEVWSARSYDPNSTIAEGRHVEVMEIDGATAIVYESEI